MTRVFDDPAAFADEALAGFASAYPSYVVRLDGGVVRAAASHLDQVALVIGGGSGHYPAFAGLVGSGLATAAACGKVFASPSARQVYRVARVAEQGGGVLLSYGNYSGDRMQFGQAEQRLRAEGIDVRTVLVTDDIASGPPDQVGDRRGIAGGIAVFKVAGAAAEMGLRLDEVERLARKANSRTRSLGVAFGGCTLPGAPGPLFTVPSGYMSIGLGIHGEPGVSDVTMPTARELARLLVAKLLGERLDGIADRAVVVLNGLGTVKYEELLLLFGHVASELAAAGVEIADAECGEFVTSLDMSGLSLTLFWVDEELEELWSAPADTPAYRKAARSNLEQRSPKPVDIGPTVSLSHEPATAASQELAKLAAVGLEVAREVVEMHEDELGALDAVAGDGDHGHGMCRGAGAAAEVANKAIRRGAGVHELLMEAAEEWSDQAGGASGALWGTALMAMASSLGNRERYSAEDFLSASMGACAAVASLGGAQPGDKTIVDAFYPFVDVLGSEMRRGSPPFYAMRTAADAVCKATSETAALRPRKGRARPLAERSVGTPDAGATSFALIVAALSKDARVWADDGLCRYRGTADSSRPKLLPGGPS